MRSRSLRNTLIRNSFPALFLLLFEEVVFLAGGGKVLLVAGAALHCVKGGLGNLVAGVNIALPVGTNNYAAFAVLVTAFKNLF